MKPILRTIAQLGLQTALALGVGRAGALVSLQPDVQTVSPFSAFGLDVNVERARDLYAWQFDVNYGPVSFVSPNFVDEGPFLVQGGATLFTVGSFDDTNGVIRTVADTLTGPVPGVSGDGQLARLSFASVFPENFPLPPPLVIPVSVFLSNIILLDSHGNSILDEDVPNTAFSPPIFITAIPEPNLLPFLAIFALGSGCWYRCSARRRAKGGAATGWVVPEGTGGAVSTGADCPSNRAATSS